VKAARWTLKKVDSSAMYLIMRGMKGSLGVFADWAPSSAMVGYLAKPDSRFEPCNWSGSMVFSVVEWIWRSPNVPATSSAQA